MSFFHLRTLSGYSWPALPDSVISQVWVAYLELERTQWLTMAELEQRQLEQLRTLLAHAIVHVPYYREVLPRAGIVPGRIQTIDDFRRLPLLPRWTGIRFLGPGNQFRRGSALLIRRSARHPPTTKPSPYAISGFSAVQTVEPQRTQRSHRGLPLTPHQSHFNLGKLHRTCQI
jgi:hypothetical protein